MQFIIENKWFILLCSEFIAWIFTVLMAYTKYWMESKPLFIFTTITAVFTGWVVHITLPILEAFHLGGISKVLESKQALIFDFSVILILVLGIVFGKKYVMRIDNYFKNLASKKKNKS